MSNTTSGENKKKTILLIEDDPVLSKMYQTKFSNEGFEVLVANDGVKGYNMTFNNDVAVMILDIMMPKMSGIEILEKVRSTAKGKNLPVIVLTNLVQKEEKSKAIGLGVEDYLLKAEITPSQLVEKAKKYIN